MGYSNFKDLYQITTQFSLKIRKAKLLSDVQPIAPSEWLKKSIELAYTSPLSNEKIKSERLISPILIEVQQLHKDQLSLFSGEELNVQPENGLNGPCDFFYTAIPDAYILEAPIVSLAEAKNENLDYGIAQCTAQMIGAQLFNEQAGQPTPVVWGCATTAGEWKFLKLEGKTLLVDTTIYSIYNVDVLLGAFHAIFERVKY